MNSLIDHYFMLKLDPCSYARQTSRQQNLLHTYSYIISSRQRTTNELVTLIWIPQTSQLDMSVKLSANKMLDTNRQFFFSLLFSLQHFPLSHKVNYKSSTHFDMHCVTVWLLLAYSDFYSGLLTSISIYFFQHHEDYYVLQVANAGEKAWIWG